MVSIVPLLFLYWSSIVPLLLSVFSLLTPVPSRVRKHFQQVTQLVLDLRGVVHSLRNLGPDEIAKAFPQAVNRHLGRAFRQAEPPGRFGLGERFDFAQQPGLQRLELLGLARRRAWRLGCGRIGSRGSSSPRPAGKSGTAPVLAARYGIRPRQGALRRSPG